MLFTRITRKPVRTTVEPERHQLGPSPAVAVALTVARRSDLATLRTLRQLNRR